MRYVLGLDLGTSSLKGIVVNQEGRIVCTKSADYPLFNLQSGYSEQDPLDWLKAAKKVLSELKMEISDFASQLEGISFSGQMHSLVLLDENSNPLRKAILWNDVRTTEQCDTIMKECGEEILATMKNRALEGFTLPKLLWVKENEPETWKKVSKFLLPKDYLGFWMTGNIQMEYSDAAGTLLLNIAKKEWEWSVAEYFDIPKDIFPRLIGSMDQIGILREELKEEFGFTKDIPIYAGGADNACAALGAGIVEDNTGLCSIGTSGVFLTYEAISEKDYKGKLHFFNHVINDHFYSMGVTLAAGHSLSWFKNTFANDENFEELLSKVSTISPGAEGLLFAPYIVGERTPHFDSKVRGSFIGIDTRHQLAHFTRAVMEGITFSLKDSQDLVIKYADKELDKIVSIGGGAKSEEWLQMQADIFQTTIVTLTNEQGPGLGAAMIAAIGCKWFNDFQECVQTFISYGKEYKPIQKNVERYKEVYSRYKEVYPAIKEVSLSVL
ncbi:xylulokinase [Bacillus sp. B1-b2]|uniref:xylulokinase n=1 Tax=Bacillus sp. B1-b2 TaxID=2653201 RepID=UPI00126165FB|nr:xylulokinase [Bacillus sp. B1-b2]KAB7667628.1 xylulokinase [Bacillus sp. B1-b2]